MVPFLYTMTKIVQGYTNIFYTNVIDFLTLRDVYLVKTVDTQKLAKYVLSDKVEFENVGKENVNNNNNNTNNVNEEKKNGGMNPRPEKDNKCCIIF